MQGQVTWSSILESRLPLRKSEGGETLYDTISMEAILEMPVIKASKRSKRTVNQETYGLTFRKYCVIV